MTPEPIDLLLVDDSADDTAFVLHALKSAGLMPVTRNARDGAEVLTLLFGASGAAEATPLLHPRIILLDLKLPKVDGLEVLRRLRANPHTRRVPVVVWSSSLEKRDVTASYELGVNSYLVKPMDADEFAERVRVLVTYWLQFNQTPSP
jgi:two-component system, response regulator